MPKQFESETDMGSLEAYRRSRRSQGTQDLKAFQVKDIVIILTFLAGIAAIYTNVNERLVKLETKGDLIAQQLSEMKVDTTKMTSKLDETTRSLQAQIRDVEQLIVLNKPK